MTVLKQLSSQIGDRTEAANRRVAADCLDQPALLQEIAEGLDGKDAAIAGDCAEVLTKVAEQQPELVAPYATSLVPMLTHKTSRVRWESMHALALLASIAPDAIASSLPEIRAILAEDKSIIVRDYATEALGRYAETGEHAALEAYPLLIDMLERWEGKQAGRALIALSSVATTAPALRRKILTQAQHFLSHERPVVRKAVKALLKKFEMNA